jgi:poly(3-hydroxybutyrate) depolymerase
MAYPESNTPSHSWRAGCCDAAATSSEDLDFVAAVIGTLVSQGVADPAHVVVGGFSAGALLAYSFACEHARSVAAVVSVAGGLLEPPASVPSARGGRHCTPEVPVTVLEIHGTTDAALPVEGSSRGCRSTPCGPGDNGYLAPAQVINGWWRQLDSCGQPVTRTSITAQISLAHCAVGTSVGLALVVGVPHDFGQLIDTFNVRGTLLDLALSRGLTSW